MLTDTDLMKLSKMVQKKETPELNVENMFSEEHIAAKKEYKQPVYIGWRQSTVLLPRFMIKTETRIHGIQWMNVLNIYADISYSRITLEVQSSGIYVIQSTSESLETLFRFLLVERVLEIYPVEKKLVVKFTKGA